MAEGITKTSDFKEVAEKPAKARKSDGPEGTLVVSPLGDETYVPDSILNALLEAGYSKK